jgi:hypothetical protein
MACCERFREPQLVARRMSGRPDSSAKLVASNGTRHDHRFSMPCLIPKWQPATQRARATLVGMAATPDNGGCRFVNCDDGDFSYGDAPYLGTAASAEAKGGLSGTAWSLITICLTGA